MNVFNGVKNYAVDACYHGLNGRIEEHAGEAEGQVSLLNCPCEEKALSKQRFEMLGSAEYHAAAAITDFAVNLLGTIIRVPVKGIVKLVDSFKERFSRDEAKECRRDRFVEEDSEYTVRSLKDIEEEEEFELEPKTTTKEKIKNAVCFIFDVEENKEAAKNAWTAFFGGAKAAYHFVYPLLPLAQPVRGY